MTDNTSAAERLAEILGRENAALKRLDYAAAVALVADKEAALAELAAHPAAGNPRPGPLSPRNGGPPRPDRAAGGHLRARRSGEHPHPDGNVRIEHQA